MELTPTGLTPPGEKTTPTSEQITDQKYHDEAAPFVHHVLVERDMNKLIRGETVDGVPLGIDEFYRWAMEEDGPLSIQYIKTIHSQANDPRNGDRTQGRIEEASIAQSRGRVDQAYTFYKLVSTK